MRPARMRSGVLIAITLLAIPLCTLVLVGAQNHDHDRVQLAMKNPSCQPSALNTCGADMNLVRTALKSPTALWAFVASPDTGYFERLTAASDAGKLMTATWIPKILSAQNELQEEEHLHSFGIQRYPINDAAPYLDLPRDRVGAAAKGAGIKRIILGHPFLVPEKWIDFPLTDEELKKSPWPFQVSRALLALRTAIIRDGDPKRNDAIILSFPCKDVESARLLVSLTTQVAAAQEQTPQGKAYVPPEVFGAWLNVLKNPKTEAAHEYVSGMLDQASANSECPGTGLIVCPMAEVVALEVLKKQDRYVIPQIPRFHWYPHTLFLAAAHFVLSPDYRQHNSLQDQANDANILLYLTSPTRARDPFPQHLAADDATYQRVVQDFADRFKEWGASYESAAEMERPLIERTGKFLSKFTTCSAETAAKQPVHVKD